MIIILFYFIISYCLFFYPARREVRGDYGKTSRQGQG
nr:MAG TPA: chitin synthase regulator [Caudoviricetes sp.]